MSGIIRIDKRGSKNYSVVANAGLQDPRLSFQAKGMLAYLLTKPDDWDLRIDDLLTTGPDGLRVVRSALKELASCGYVKREKKRSGTGKIEWQTTVFECPQDKNFATEFAEKYPSPSAQKPPIQNVPMDSETIDTFCADTKCADIISTELLSTEKTYCANAPRPSENSPSSTSEEKVERSDTSQRKKKVAPAPYTWGCIVPLDNPIHAELIKIGLVAPDASDKRKESYERLAKDYIKNGRTVEQLQKFIAGWFEQKPTVSAFHKRRPSADEIRDYLDSVLETMGGSNARANGLASAARAERRAKQGGLHAVPR